MADPLLFHWSPTSRRRSIIRHGLRPGHWSTDRAWKPDTIAYAESPSLAWALSAMTNRGRAHHSWDLWAVWFSLLPDPVEINPADDEADRVKEWRTRGRVPKSALWFVGTRTQDGERDGRHQNRTSEES